MDKIKKTLDKFLNKEKELVKRVLTNLEKGKIQGMDLVKLRGYKDIFRVRSGKIRIIFRMQAGSIFVLAIERRPEKTYRAF